MHAIGSSDARTCSFNMSYETFDSSFGEKLAASFTCVLISVAVVIQSRAAVKILQNTLIRLPAHFEAATAKRALAGTCGPSPVITTSHHGDRSVEVQREKPTSC